MTTTTTGPFIWLHIAEAVERGMGADWPDVIVEAKDLYVIVEVADFRLTAWTPNIVEARRIAAEHNKA